MSTPESFLPEKYHDLPGSKPVERAVVKSRKDPAREYAPHSREERVQAYLDRLDTIVKDERGWELLKNKIIKKFTINLDDEATLAKIAHSLYESERRIAAERGHGKDAIHIEHEEILKQYATLAQEKRDIQARTLTAWLDYLKQNDAKYPMWFQYFIMRNLKQMGTLDKEKGEYTKRTDYTIAPFPELNSEALGFVYRMLTTGIGHQEFIGNPTTDSPERQEVLLAKRTTLEALITKKDFMKLYAFAQIETAGQLNRESLQGEWVKYDQGSDYHILEDALHGKGTGWCTAEGSAYSHLEGGDFYVYYTRGIHGTYSEPRIAIRMEDDSVAEVRGVNQRQELEPALIDTATKKYQSLPGGERFTKKSHDMKWVTELAKKQEAGASLTKDDLTFLYEFDAPIEGFGYYKDPRVAELLATRDPDMDMLVLFDCAEEQIAHAPTQINEKTKAYIGPLEPGIFSLFEQYNIDHIYTSFPERRIQREQFSVGGTTKAQLLSELTIPPFMMFDNARSMITHKNFTTSATREDVILYSLTIHDLGLRSDASPEEVLSRAEEIGLESCAAEVGPYYRLHYRNQPMNTCLRIGMKPIVSEYQHDYGKSHGIFELAHRPWGLVLGSDMYDGGPMWNSWRDRYAFRFRMTE